MLVDSCRDCDAKILAILDRLEKKVDGMAETLHQIEVLKTRQGHYDEGMARAFKRIEALESEHREYERFVAFVRGMAWAAGIVWAVTGAGITYVAGKVVALTAGG